MINKIRDFMAQKVEEAPKKANKKTKVVDQDEALKVELETLKAELEESKDKYLRLFAEFDNFKKRSIKERFELLKTASQETMQVLLPVLDDFERAKKSADSGVESFSEGVQLVYNKLFNTLESKGLKAMESTGAAFDAEWHEAITDIPAPSEEMKGMVIDTIEKGYVLNEKIIRHAKVIVGK
jgi:molecular chaperone GrpE